MANYAIGDIQGCFQELQLLLNQIHYRPAEDQLWLVGDLVNRGPDSLQVLRFLSELATPAKIVLGNHDLHLLAVAAAVSPLKSFDTLTVLLDAPDASQLLHWLRQQPLIHYDAELDVVMSHAGIYPFWTLTQAQQYAAEVTTQLQQADYKNFLAAMYGNIPDQWSEDLTGNERLRFITNAFTRMRFCSAAGQLELTNKGEMQNPPAGYSPWFKIPQRAAAQHNIIFGHWAALNGVTGESKVHALDTGCAWGHSLTAQRLEDGQRFSVPSLMRSKTS